MLPLMASEPLPHPAARWAHVTSLLILASCVNDQNESTRSLVLERSFTREIPDTFAVSAVGATAEGEVFVWSTERSTGLLEGENGWASFELGTASPVGLTVHARTPEEISLTVLDGSSRRLIEVHDGEVRGSRFVNGEGAIMRGVASHEAWFGTQRVEDRVEVVKIPPVGPPTTLFRLDRPGSTELHLHSWNGGDLLVTEVRSPFRTFGINSTGDTLVVFDAPLDPAPDSDGYAALPMLPVGEGFLQVLADLRSTRRILVTYDRDGALLRRTDIEGRIGLTHAMSGRPILLGLQDMGRQELVAFRWRWIDSAG